MANKSNISEVLKWIKDYPQNLQLFREYESRGRIIRGRYYYAQSAEQIDKIIQLNSYYPTRTNNKK